MAQAGPPKLRSYDGEGAPAEIEFDTVITDVIFHPTRDVIAAGDILGNVHLYSYSTETANHELMVLDPHKKSCRALCYSSDGQNLFTVSKDKSLQVIDMGTGTVTYRISPAHNSALYSICNINNYLIATGDEDGTLKVWDFRNQNAVMEKKESEEFISAIVVDTSRGTMLATSGEGTLTAFDFRRRQTILQSELFESEFLSLAVVKGGSKVVVGTGEGALNLFNWGEWGNISDRFPGHPLSIDAMVAINEELICTGSMDGEIRAVQIFPNKILGLVGNHPDFPVEKLSLSRDGTLLASCSHDQKVKFWDATCLEERLGKEEEARRSHKRGFFADLEDQ